jgi:hypothetical protein
MVVNLLPDNTLEAKRLAQVIGLFVRANQMCAETGSVRNPTFHSLDKKLLKHQVGSGPAEMPNPSDLRA